MNQRPPQPPGWIRHFPWIAGLCVAATGAVVLVGWFQNLEVLTSLSSRFVSMKANAAAAFVLLGSALVLAALARNAVTQALRWALELAALAIGVATVVEYA